jgi:hypothetical protein
VVAGGRGALRRAERQALNIELPTPNARHWRWNNKKGAHEARPCFSVERSAFVRLSER